MEDKGLIIEPEPDKPESSLCPYQCNAGPSPHHLQQDDRKICMLDEDFMHKDGKIADGNGNDS